MITFISKSHKKCDYTYIHETTHHISNVCSPSVRCQSFDARYTSRVDRVAASRIQKLVKKLRILHWDPKTSVACMPTSQSKIYNTYFSYLIYIIRNVEHACVTVSTLDLVKHPFAPEKYRTVFS